MKKVTRRQLLAASVATAAIAEGQSPTGSSQEDWAKVSREANQRNAEALSKFDIPVSTEPAFVFKA